MRCAPPDNKPTPEEIASCLPHLEAELDALPRVRVVVALGRIALRRVSSAVQAARSDAAAAAAVCARLDRSAAERHTLIGCYHPSRQNTNTGKLTARMMDDVFQAAARALKSS